MRRLTLITLLVFASLLLLSSCGGTDVDVIVDSRAATQAVLQTEYAAASTLALSDARQATLLAESLRATQQAAVFQATLRAGIDQATATAAVAQTQVALQTTSTTQAIIAQANQLNYQAEQQRLDIRRREMFNSILGWAVFLLVLGVLALAGWGVWQYLRGAVAERRMEEAAALAPYVVFDRYGRRVVGGPALVPMRVVESRVTRTTRSVRPSSPLEGVGRASPPLDLPDSAPWQIVEERWREGMLPLGMGPAGLITVDPLTDPHLLITGTPGSGKANLAVRPLIAAALAGGWQAVIVDRTGADFEVFRDHPNASLLLVEGEGPAEAIGYLRRLHREVQRRAALLSSSGALAWSDLEAPAPELLAVFNNFSYEVAGAISFPDRTELWQFARLVAAEGGPVGVHLLLVMEDPGFTDMDLRIRRYVSPVAFRAESELVSRVLLNMDGAENLLPRQFIALLDGEVVFGYAFAPGDEDLLRFLEARPREALPRPEWIGEGQASE